MIIFPSFSLEFTLRSSPCHFGFSCFLSSARERRKHTWRSVATLLFHFHDTPRRCDTYARHCLVFGPVSRSYPTLHDSHILCLLDIPCYHPLFCRRGPSALDFWRATDGSWRGPTLAGTTPHPPSTYVHPMPHGFVRLLSPRLIIGVFFRSSLVFCPCRDR